MYDYFMEELVYQMFILGSGEYLGKGLQKGLGGVIFFTRDIESKEQFKELISYIKQISKIPPFLSIDQEGGRVERTENIRPRRLSAQLAFEKGEKFLANQTEEIASELKDYGINLNFAPVADVNTNTKNPIIGERAFSNNPDKVIKGIDVTTNIYRKYGIIPCIKHYPGHGDADRDSHLTLPKISLDLRKMEKVHIKPFKHAIENGIEMIMAAHLHCTCFDNDSVPTSLSKNAIGYLRNNLKYDGIIISDDMFMKGVGENGGIEAVLAGINAGLDMFIYRDADQKTFNLIEKVAQLAKKTPVLQEKIIKSNERIKNLKAAYSIIN